VLFTIKLCLKIEQSNTQMIRKRINYMGTIYIAETST